MIWIDECYISFIGEDKNFTVQEFLFRIEKAALILNWSMEYRMNFTLNALSGTAAIQMKASKNCNDWNRLKSKLLELFGPFMSVSDQISIIRKIQGTYFWIIFHGLKWSDGFF